MKRFLVRLCLWVFLLTGLGFSFLQILDARRSEKARQEAVRIAGVSGERPFPAGVTALETEVGEEMEERDLGGLEKDGCAGKEEAAFLAGINLKALQEENQDVVGWMEIPGTKLSYPIVQGGDNDYYLNRNWKKERSKSGSIFLECTNSSDFSDFHTIVYGHRMRDRTMFGVLKDYQSLDFLREHPSVYLVFGDGICRYDIFAAYETGVKSMLYRLDLEEKGMEEEFLKFCLESSVFDAGIVPEPGTPILTLSTCTGRGHATRWVVQGYLAQRYPKGS